MLGGNHYKKKLAKKARKTESKEAKKQPPQQQHAFYSNNKSTLKGSVVSHADIKYSADDGNDANHSNVKKGMKGDKDNSRRAEPGATASSKSQKKRFSKFSGDDLLDQFKAKLSGSTFRLLNEQIYNSPNAFAQQLLKDNSTFEDYHSGYRLQLAQWPVDPNKLLVESILSDKKGRFLQNKLHHTPGAVPTNWVIADLGCGDANVARSLVPRGYAVHSIDLCESPKNQEFITVANSANTPLGNASVDVATFSLSLMATDWFDCIVEAYRILKPKRMLKIIEVRSRIPDARMFAELVCKIGFTCDWNEVVGSYLVAFDFIRNDKSATSANLEPCHHPNDVLLPSLYKKR